MATPRFRNWISFSPPSNAHSPRGPHQVREEPMHMLIFLLWLANGALVLNILGFFTARAAAYLAQRDRTARASPPSPPQDASIHTSAALTIAADVAAERAVT